MGALDDAVRQMVADEVARQLAATRNAPDRLLSVGQAVERMGIGRSAVYALISRGDLRSVKVLNAESCRRPR